MTTLGALTDVTLTAPLLAGQSLAFNGAVWENKLLNLNDLGDVTALAPTDGQTIVWDSTANAGAGGYVLGNAGSANPSIHLTDTAVAPATALMPTLAEITAAAGTNRDAILYYTGSDTATDPVSYAYFIDVAGTVTQIEAPAAAATNPIVHLTNTSVAPATAGDPTLAEIAAAAGANRDVFLTYTGTDLATDPVIRSYYIDPAGTVVLVEEPTTATCNLRELGGVGGILALNDGLGIPNPVATGYTLAADRLFGVVTTAPVGGNDTFEVRLMPVATVLSVGTVAAGATAATFSAYADTVLTSGQWIEVVVTGVSPGTPSAELTVVGELCGPGTPTTVTAGGPDTDSAFHNQAVASTTWTITHGLPFTPAAIHIEDLAGNDVQADDITFGPTTVVVTFLGAQSGTARIS